MVGPSPPPPRPHMEVPSLGGGRDAKLGDRKLAKFNVVVKKKLKMKGFLKMRGCSAQLRAFCDKYVETAGACIFIVNIM